MNKIISPIDDFIKKEYYFHSLINNINLYIITFTLLEYEVNYKKNYKYKRELENLSKYMANGLYYYGMYSIAREISHIFDSFFIDNNIIHEIIENYESELDIEYYIDIGIDKSAKELKLKKYKNVAKKIYKNVIYSTELMNFITGSFNIERTTSFSYYFSRLFPIDIYKKENTYGMAILFNINYKTNENYEEYEIGWDKQYGGKAWSNIALTLSKKDKIPDIIFIDNCLDLQHNNGLWFDKIKFDKKGYLDETKEILDYRLKGDFEMLKMYYNDYLNEIYKKDYSDIEFYRMVI